MNRIPSGELDCIAQLTAQLLQACFARADKKTEHKMRVYFMMRLSEELRTEEKEEKEDEQA